MASFRQIVLGLIVLIYVCQAKRHHDHDEVEDRDSFMDHWRLCHFLTDGLLKVVKCQYGCCGNSVQDVCCVQSSGVLGHEGEESDHDNSREDDDDDDDNGHGHRDSSRIGILAAIAVVSVLIIVVLATLCYFVLRRSKLRQANRTCRTGIHPSAPPTGFEHPVYMDPVSNIDVPPTYEEIAGDIKKSPKHSPSDQPPPYTANPIY